MVVLMHASHVAHKDLPALHELHVRIASARIAA